jgi:hypothetical protein
VGSPSEVRGVGKPPGPGKSGLQRDSSDDVSSLVGTPPEGRGEGSLHVRGIVRNLKNFVFV